MDVHLIKFVKAAAELHDGASVNVMRVWSIVFEAEKVDLRMDCGRLRGAQASVFISDARPQLFIIFSWGCLLDE